MQPDMNDSDEFQARFAANLLQPEGLFRAANIRSPWTVLQSPAGGGVWGPVRRQEAEGRSKSKSKNLV